MPDRGVNHGQSWSLPDKSQRRSPGLMQLLARSGSAFQAGHEGSIPFARSNQKHQVKTCIVKNAHTRHDVLPLRRARCVSDRFPAEPFRLDAASISPMAVAMASSRSVPRSDPDITEVGSAKAATLRADEDHTVQPRLHEAAQVPAQFWRNRPYILLPTAKLVALRFVRAGDSFVRVSA